MAKMRDRFGNDRNEVRVPLEASIVGFDEHDIENLNQFISEAEGYAGEQIQEFLEVLGISAQELRAMTVRLVDARSLQGASREDLCHLFVLANLVCAALGDEELATITGSGRDEHFLTIRRIYFAFTNSQRLRAFD